MEEIQGKKKRRGKKGKDFEALIKKCAEKDNIFFLRLQDNLKFGGKIQGARFSQKSPYDSILFCPPNLFCLEMKSKEGTSLSYGEKSSCDIKQHQIDALTEASQYKEVIAGFLIRFKERRTSRTYREEDVFFINITDFNNFISKSSKKSISYDDCKKIGMVVPKENVGKRVVKYEYKIQEMIDKIREIEKKTIN